MTKKQENDLRNGLNHIADAMTSQWYGVQHVDPEHRASNMTTTFSYEDQILNQRERESDDCAGCPFAGVDTCRNQCHEVTAIYNPNLTHRKE